MKYKLNQIEQETILNYNNADADAEVYTCDRKTMDKLDKLCDQYPDIFRLKSEDEYSKTYYFPKKLISIKTPRVFTAEQKKKMRERGQQAIKNIHEYYGQVSM